MKEWFSNLQPREQIMVLSGAVVLVILMFYLIVWDPLNKSVDTLENTVTEQESLLKWMQNAAAEAQRLRGTQTRPATRGSGQSLLSLIDSTAKSGQLGGALKRVKPDGDDKVHVWLENASFDDMVKWLESLQRTYAIEVLTITIDRQDIPGRVDARVVVSESS
jgi:general secretion pathway protein M